MDAVNILDPLLLYLRAVRLGSPEEVQGVIGKIEDKVLLARLSMGAKR